MIKFKPVLGACSIVGALGIVLAHAWATRAIEPQLAQDNNTYCRNWQVQLNMKVGQFNSSCTGPLDRQAYVQCGQWKEDLDTQAARFSSRCAE